MPQSPRWHVGLVCAKDAKLSCRGNKIVPVHVFGAVLDPDHLMAAKSRYSLKGRTRGSYLELVLAFPLASIKSEDQLLAAQEVMDRLLARGVLDAGESLYLDALSDLVASYEDEHHVIGPASDADMLRHLMEAKGVSQADLSRESGISRSTVSEVLAGKKPFSRQLIRKLASYFQVDASLLAGNFPSCGKVS